MSETQNNPEVTPVVETSDTPKPKKSKKDIDELLEKITKLETDNAKLQDERDLANDLLRHMEVTRQKDIADKQALFNSNQIYIQTLEIVEKAVRSCGQNRATVGLGPAQFFNPVLVRDAFTALNNMKDKLLASNT